PPAPLRCRRSRPRRWSPCAPPSPWRSRRRRRSRRPRTGPRSSPKPRSRTVLRVLLSVPVALACTMALGLPSIAVGLVDHGGRFARRAAGAWGRLLLVTWGVRVVVAGRQHGHAEPRRGRAHLQAGQLRPGPERGRARGAGLAGGGEAGGPARAAEAEAGHGPAHHPSPGPHRGARCPRRGRPGGPGPPGCGRRLRAGSRGRVRRLASPSALLLALALAVPSAAKERSGSSGLQ